MEQNKSFLDRLKTFFIGKPRDYHDQALLHRISLIALFAWVGLGADGLSSSSYGPQEASYVLQGHLNLGIIVALATALTVLIISASYSQIVELFPGGGGGYLVASKLLSPSLGMLSGCALMIDYVLTIAVSIASGADAVFSFLPPEWYHFKLAMAIAVIFILIILNMRGVKESVVVLMPIFFLFMITHVFLIFYSFGFHLINFPQLAAATSADIARTKSSLGLFGMFFLLMRSYSMGAGTYTGIEAVSNGVTILREPRVETAKKTMLYMSTSLAFMVLGIMLSYVFYKVVPVAGKTMNAVLFSSITANFNPGIGYLLVTVTLLSEALLLFVAAQTGFIDGPRVLSNMALDRWVPKRYAILSDRLVSQNGILIMGISSLILMMATNGSIGFLIVLYSINVFLTFFLSQLGMVRHWWEVKKEAKNWIGKIFINGTGLFLTAFILISVIVIKFHEGGWITLFITGSLVALAIIVKQNYVNTDKMVQKHDEHVMSIEITSRDYIPILKGKQEHDPNAQTAVMLVKDFNSIGVQTISTILHSFNGVFKNFIFVQVGLVNAGNLAEVKKVEDKIKCEVNKYVDLVQSRGYHAEGFCLTGIDTVEEFGKIIPDVLEHFPHSIFFGGQVVFPNDNFFSRWLHNYTLFAIQRRLYNQGISLFILPIYVK